MYSISSEENSEKELMPTLIGRRTGRKNASISLDGRNDDLAVFKSSVNFKPLYQRCVEIYEGWKVVVSTLG
jgi:hypothetical protein